MKKSDWRVKLSIILILLSVLLYSFHYFIFRDAHHIFLYLVGDLAFIPIEVLLVSLVIDGVIKIRERQGLIEKLNLIIGVYFNEVGTTILKYCTSIDPNVDQIANSLIVYPNWEEKDFKKALEKCKTCNYEIEFHKIDLEKMNEFLLSKKGFLLRLLENPYLFVTAISNNPFDTRTKEEIEKNIKATYYSK